MTHGRTPPPRRAEPPRDGKPGEGEPADSAPPDRGAARAAPRAPDHGLPDKLPDRVLELPEHGLSDDDLPDRAVLERIWRVLSRWAVPVMMTLAYVLLAATSDTNAAGKSLMAAGLALVFIIWFVFRALTESAALSRALDVGDVARLLALADRHLPRTRRPALRTRLLVARGLAHQLRGDFTAALTALDETHAPPDHASSTPDRASSTPDHASSTPDHASSTPYHASSTPDRASLPPDRAPQPPDRARSMPDSARASPDVELLALVVRLAALIELGRPTADLRVPPSSPRRPALGSLAEGQLALSDGDLETAAQRFARVIDDIRAGASTRAIARLYAARTAAARGDSTAAAHHRAAAAALAAPDATWLRSPA